MNVLHISDIHFKQNYPKCTTGYQSVLYKMQQPLKSLKTCLECIDEPIDVIVISGDLTDDGTVEDYRYLKQWLKHQVGEIPILVTLGNHDIKANFYKGWLDVSYSNMPYNTIMYAKDCVFVSFDNAVDGMSNGHISQQQFEWLEQTLAKIKKPIILVTHHHLLKTQCSLPPVSQYQKLWDIVKNSTVTCILNGHTHHAYHTQVDGIVYFTAPGMSFVGEDEGSKVIFDERFGYSIYNIEKGKVMSSLTEVFFTHKILGEIEKHV